MAEQMSLTDVLSEKEPEPREPAAPAAPPAEAPAPSTEPPVERAKSSRKAHEDKEQAAQGRVRDPDTGQFVKIEEKAAEAPKAPEAKAPEAKAPATPAAPPQQEFTEKEKAFLRTAEEERRKRQELERRLAALEGARQQQPQAPQEPAKTFYDDPEGALAKQMAEIRKENINTRLSTAELIARRHHPDFDEKIAVFNQIVEKTPGLIGQMIAAADPAEFAYGLGKSHMELQQAGSIEGLRAQIEKETRLKVEAEMKEKAEKLAQERAALPPSLSEARSTGVNRPVWGGPPPLDDVLKGA